MVKGKKLPAARAGLLGSLFLSQCLVLLNQTFYLFIYTDRRLVRVTPMKTVSA